MKLAVLKERLDGEPRVAATPDTVKRFAVARARCGDRDGRAGVHSGIVDDAYAAAGAEIAGSPGETAENADIILKVRGATRDEIPLVKRGALVDWPAEPLRRARDDGGLMPSAGLLAFAMELLPRISRAQSMDVLSSQSNLAGYRAVIDAAAVIARAFPMMMTAAGTVPPARVSGDGRRRCRLAGNRNRQAAWRHRLGERCAARSEGASGIAGRHFRCGHRRRVQSRRDRRRLCQRDVEGISGQASRADRADDPEAGCHHHHGADTRPRRRRAWFPPR